MAVGADGNVYITNHSSAAVHLAVTVVGYYSGMGATSPGDTYFDAGSQKIVDTTAGIGTSQAPIPGGGSITIQVGGRVQHPDGR